MTPEQQGAFLFLLAVQVLAIGLLAVTVVIVTSIKRRLEQVAADERSIMTTELQFKATLDQIRDAVVIVVRKAENLAATVKNLQDQLLAGTVVNQGQLDDLQSEAQAVLAMLSPLAGDAGGPPAPAVTPVDPPPAATPSDSSTPPAESISGGEAGGEANIPPVAPETPADTSGATSGSGEPPAPAVTPSDAPPTQG